MIIPGEKDENGVMRFRHCVGDFAYVIQSCESGGVCKVGRSSDPERRIAGLCSGVPFKLRTIAIMNNGAARERAMKVALAGSKLRGEWFSPTALLNSILRDAHREGGVLISCKIDEDFHHAYIVPALMRMNEGMKLNHNYCGDLVYRAIHQGFATYKDRIADLVAYSQGGISPEMGAGWVPMHPEMPAPEIMLPVNTGDPQVVSPAGA